MKAFDKAAFIRSRIEHYIDRREEGVLSTEEAKTIADWIELDADFAQEIWNILSARTNDAP